MIIAETYKFVVIPFLDRTLTVSRFGFERLMTRFSASSNETFAVVLWLLVSLWIVRRKNVNIAVIKMIALFSLATACFFL